jgi:hypothetical protein
MIKEEKQLIEALRIAFSNDVAELEVSFLSDFFSSFEDYLTNRLSAEDYEYFVSRFEKFQKIWSKYTYKNHIKDLSDYFPLLNEYYKVNAQRNHVFFDKIAQFLPISAHAEDNDIVVLVSGGFHTEGLTKILPRRPPRCRRRAGPCPGPFRDVS